MREGWTYKRLGEVGSFLRGKSIQKADFVEKGLPCIHYGQIHTKFGVSVDKHLSEIPSDIYEKSIIASPGDVIIAITSEDLEGSCKSTAWLGDYDVAVSAHAAVYKHNLNSKYIVYYLRSNSFYVEKEKYARGFKVMEIKPTDIARIPIPIPPISIQQSIVAELDKTNELIGLKKSQLSDLDSLAQSIFFEMFGDPVKGIKFKRSTIGNVITNIKYGTGSPPQFSDSGFCFIRATNIKNGHIDSKDMLYIDANEASRIEKCRLSSNDLIIVRSGVNAGDTSNIPTEYVGHYAGYDIIITVNKELVNTTYINGVLNNKDYVRMIIKPLTRRAAQPHLNSQQVQGMSIPLPPLPLQQSFAARITAIEQQKQRISASIKDLETLLASRMQYWFDG